MESLTVPTGPEEVEWHWLRPHQQRGALILVAPALDLQLVADKVAADDTVTVGAWIADGALLRPSAAQLEAWEAAPMTRLRMLIVQPYVLAQELKPATPN